LNADIMERPDYLVEVHLWPVIQWPRTEAKVTGCGGSAAAKV
jgi:hypothetical protein